MNPCEQYGQKDENDNVPHSGPPFLAQLNRLNSGRRNASSQGVFPFAARLDARASASARSRRGRLPRAAIEAPPKMLANPRKRITLTRLRACNGASVLSGEVVSLNKEASE
jgi:hypothetical protein